MITTNDLLLTSTLQVKNSLDQVVTMLKMVSDTQPELKPIYESYKVIVAELDKTATALKEIKHD